MLKYDAIVIGTGQAGPSLAADLARQGKKTAILERGKFGGTCVNYGCIPTKTMVASARAAFVARRAAEYGVRIGGAIEVDMARVIARKEEVVAKSRNGVETWLRGTAGVDVFEGHGRFVGPQVVKVGDEELQAEQIFINVGTRAHRPPIEGLNDVETLTNVDMLAMESVPKHLVVVGGSYIGLEFGQMYRRFGSEVTIVERANALVSREDPDVSAAAQEILEAEGIAVHTDSNCISVSPHRGGVEVGIRCGDEPLSVVGSHVLVAVGRVPNTDDLGLESAGVRMNERGYIQVDDRLQTSAEGVWAMGDVNGRGAFTHTSYNDYEIVADQLWGTGKRRVSDRILAYALYVDPPFARVGMSEKDARESGRDILVARRPMTKVGRAVEKGETLGFMKALVDAKTERILGFSIVGTGGDEAIHSVLDIMYADVPYTVIRNAMHIHPTVSELIPTLLGDLEPLR